jgi:hypothetical protein
MLRIALQAGDPPLVSSTFSKRNFLSFALEERRSRGGLFWVLAILAATPGSLGGTTPRGKVPAL